MRILDMKIVGRNFFDPTSATVLQQYRLVHLFLSFAYIWASRHLSKLGLKHCDDDVVKDLLYTLSKRQDFLGEFLVSLLFASSYLQIHTTIFSCIVILCIFHDSLEILWTDLGLAVSRY